MRRQVNTTACTTPRMHPSRSVRDVYGRGCVCRWMCMTLDTFMCMRVQPLLSRPPPSLHVPVRNHHGGAHSHSPPSIAHAQRHHHPSHTHTHTHTLTKCQPTPRVAATGSCTRTVAGSSTHTSSNGRNNARGIAIARGRMQITHSGSHPSQWTRTSGTDASGTDTRTCHQLHRHAPSTSHHPASHHPWGGRRRSQRNHRSHGMGRLLAWTSLVL